MPRSHPPYRWTIGLFAVLGSSALAFIQSRSLLSWASPDPVAVSAEYRQAALLPGMLMAGVSAWAASLSASPSTAYAPAGSRRRGLPLAVSDLSYLGTLAVLGFTAGMAPSTIQALRALGTGYFDLASIVSGYACLIAYIGAGYLTGCLLPVYLAVPGAVAGSYVSLIVLPGVIRPLLDFDVGIGLAVPAAVSVLRSAFFLACAGSTTLAAGVWLRRRTTTAYREAAAGVALLLTPVLLVAYFARSYAQPLVVDAAAEPRCLTAGRALVCLHPARSSLLPPLAEGVDRLAQAAGPTLLPLETVYESSVAPHAHDENPPLVFIQDKYPRWVNWALAEVAGHATGADTCYDSPYADVSSAAAAWLMTEAGESAGLLLQSPMEQKQYAILERLGRTKARTLLERSIADIRLCRLATLG